MAATSDWGKNVPPLAEENLQHSGDGRWEKFQSERSRQSGMAKKKKKQKENPGRKRQSCRGSFKVSLRWSGQAISQGRSARAGSCHCKGS